MGEAVQGNLKQQCTLRQNFVSQFYLHWTLPKQHWSDLDVLEVRDLAPIVHHPRLVDQVKA